MVKKVKQEKKENYFPSYDMDKGLRQIKSLPTRFINWYVKKGISKPGAPIVKLQKTIPAVYEAVRQKFQKFLKKPIKANSNWLSQYVFPNGKEKITL